MKQQREPAPGLEQLLAVPRITFEGNRFRAAYATAAWLVLQAYGGEYRHRDQIVGGPGWIDVDQFEIDAVASAVLPPQTGSAIRPIALPEPVAEMFRTLLEVRFKLRVVREMRELPVYVLVRAREDGRLGEGVRFSEEDCDARIEKPGLNTGCRTRIGMGRISLVGEPVEDLVKLLMDRTGRLVINETGLTGNIDLELVWRVDDPSDLVSRNAGIYSALEDQLGLRLESRRMPVPVLVIEQIERPSEN